MIKLNGIAEDGKNVQRTKYIVSSLPNNTTTLTLNGTELIPIDWEARLINHSTYSIADLGKQLLKAASDGNVDDLKSLLTKGAPFTADWLGTSPLHLAAQNNHLEITEILLRAGISKDARTKVDRTPLHMAAYEGHLQIVDTLIKHGADIDCQDLLGMTPLHWAVQNGHFEVVELLVSNGAEINGANKFDLTPLMIAQQINRIDIENLINAATEDATIAAQNLVIQLASEDSMVDGSANNIGMKMEIQDDNQEPIIIPLEPTILQQLSQQVDIEDDNSQTEIEEQFEEELNTASRNMETGELNEHLQVQSNEITDLLQDGITMLQNDENEANILNSAMQSGHSVVLTDVGKEMLNSLKQSEHKQQPQQILQQSQPLQMEKKIVTVTPEEFLAITNCTFNKKVIKQWKDYPKNQVRRIVMKRTRTAPIPVTTVINLPEISEKARETSNAEPSDLQPDDLESVMAELIEARKTIEEYKIKLRNKDLEMEQYKMQLKLLLDSS